MGGRYYKLDYAGKDYIFDSKIMKKDKVNYFKDYVNSMSIDDIIERLNEQDSEIEELKKKTKKTKSKTRKTKTKKEKKKED